MIPIFEIAGKPISAYTILLTAGVLISLLVIYKKTQKEKLNEINTLFMFLISFIGVFFGSHLLYAVTQTDKLPQFFASVFSLSFESFDDFLLSANEIFGGAVFYGGLIGAIIAAGIYAKRANLTVEYIDIATLAIPLFHTFGRIGCFLTGCCYGIEFPIGVTYHYHPDPSVNGITRFPVQLVEAIFNLILFLILYRLVSKRKYKGQILPIYLVSYAIARFLLEFLRGDEIRGHLGVLSTSQIISILILIAVTVYEIIYKKRKKKQNI